MHKNALDNVLHYLRRIALTGPGQGSDAGLLDRFARQGDDAAFERLVGLHGPMVLGLCRRLLRQEQDAEDAFQATFLTLARKAGTINNKQSLASWLYKVAYRVAYRVRGAAPVFADAKACAQDTSDCAGEGDALRRERRGVIDHEVAALSEVYRRPIVLCYFEGKTNEEAARLLGCPIGTVATRLARAREQLRRRLSRRGWALSAGLFTTVMTETAFAATLPMGLARSTVGSALAYTAGKAAGAAVVSEKVLVLSEGVLRMMWFSKMKMVAGVVLAVVLAGTGVGLVARHTWAGAGAGDAQGERRQPVPQNAQPDLKPGTEVDAKAEIAELRKEIARLREEIKLLAALQQGNAPPESGPSYRGKSTAFWLNQFKDADPKYRAEAVAALGRLARKNTALIPVLINALNDHPYFPGSPGFVHSPNNDDDAVETAITALLHFGSEVVPMLLDVIKDKSSPNARENAIRVLSRLRSGAKDAVPLLTESLQDGTIRELAVVALGHIGPDAKPAIPALIKLLGPSIQAFKARGDKEGWSKLPPNTGGFIPEQISDQILNALVAIDPAIKKILPSFIEGFIPAQNGLHVFHLPRYERLATRWQNDYEALKKKYRTDK